MLIKLFSYFSPQEKKKLYYLSLLKNDNCVLGFSIHGLWSDYGDGTYPQCCKKVSFDIDKLNPIINDMKDYWPEDKDKIEGSFWEHEWKKHGSCMFQEMDELEYFEKALDLYMWVMNESGIDIEKHKKGKNFMIPFNLNFEYIK